MQDSILCESVHTRGEKLGGGVKREREIERETCREELRETRNVLYYYNVLCKLPYSSFIYLFICIWFILFITYLFCLFSLVAGRIFITSAGKKFDVHKQNPNWNRVRKSVQEHTLIYFLYHQAMHSVVPLTRTKRAGIFFFWGEGE